MGSPNKSEEKVGKAFKKSGLSVYYQYSVGPYTLDIFLPKLKVCIEVYGPHHIETKRQLIDKARQEYIEAEGITVYIITAQQANTADEVRNLVNRVLRENNAPSKTKKDKDAEIFNGLQNHLDRWVNSTGFDTKPPETQQPVSKEKAPKEEDFATLLDKSFPIKRRSKREL
ncbi:MAG: DUF559 domain-containing protein [Peptococcaceae bacterium]|nr:DUF559 domain-containing protein [Peptococcaceae bacterium]